MLTVERVTPGPVGKGTRFRTQVKTRQRTAEMSVEFTPYDRPRRLTSVSKMSNMEIEGTLTFDPVPEGTRMRWSWDLASRGTLMLATPIISLIGRREERTSWTNLKQHESTRDPMHKHSANHARGVPKVLLGRDLDLVAVNGPVSHHTKSRQQQESSSVAD